MNRNNIEYPWLNDNEAMYYDETNGVYHYEVSYPTGNHRFYISTKMESRPISRELINEYANFLGVPQGILTPTFEEPAVVISEPSIEYNPESKTLVVTDEHGNETAHQMPENPGDYHTLNIKDVTRYSEASVEFSLIRWRNALPITATDHSHKHEYLNVGGYDKVVIMDDIMVVYTSEGFEMIKIPESKEHKKLIMSDDLITIIEYHNQKAG